MKKILMAILLVSMVVISCKKGGKKVLIQTKYGDIVVELYDSTPLHRDNFLKLVKEGFYDSLLFHRVIDGFMIQGGDPESKGADKNKILGAGGPGYTLPPEIHELHYRGAVAAARMGNQVNPEKRSSGSQFYIVQGKKHLTLSDIQSAEKRNKLKYTEEQIQKYLKEGGYPFLDGEYTVFGRVVKGMDVVDKIAKVKKSRHNRPVEDIVMKIKIID